MTIFFDEFGNRPHQIAFDQFDLMHVAEEAISVVLLNQLAQFVEAIGLEFALAALLELALIARTDRGKALEGIEAVDAACEIFGFENRAELGPRHQAEPAEHAALDHRAFDRQNQLENFVQRQKTLELLAPHVLGKILELGLDAIAASIEDAFDIAADLALSLGAELLHARFPSTGCRSEIAD